MSRSFATQALSRTAIVFLKKDIKGDNNIQQYSGIKGVRDVKTMEATALE